MTINRADYLDGFPDNDEPVLVGNSQPVPSWRVTELMLQALRLTKNDTLLEVGTGSGYQTACWAEHCKEVVTLEPHPIPGVDERLPKNVTMSIHESFTDYIPDQLFDAIVVTCGITLEQAQMLGGWLKAGGGRLVAPVGNPRGQELIRLERNECGIEDNTGPIGYCNFLWMGN